MGYSLYADYWSISALHEILIILSIMVEITTEWIPYAWSNKTCTFSIVLIDVTQRQGEGGGLNCVHLCIPFLKYISINN